MSDQTKIKPTILDARWVAWLRERWAHKLQRESEYTRYATPELRDIVYSWIDAVKAMEDAEDKIFEIAEREGWMPEWNPSGPGPGSDTPGDES